MTDRYLHLLAQEGHPRPQPARSWAFSALPSSGLLGLSLHSGTKAQCSVRGGIPVQKRAGRQGGQQAVQEHWVRHQGILDLSGNAITRMLRAASHHFQSTSQHS